MQIICLKHNYSGNQSCKLCEEENSSIVQEKDILNHILESLLRETNNSIIEILKESSKQDWVKLQHAVSGARVICIILEVLSGQTDKTTYAHLNVKLPGNYKDMVEKLDLVQETCFINLTAFQDFYDQHSKKLSS